MGRGRAYRRHQAWRAKRRAYEFLSKRWGLEAPRPGHVGLFASTHCCPCSCEICGNVSRRSGGEPPRRAVLAELAEREQCQESAVQLR